MGDFEIYIVLGEWLWLKFLPRKVAKGVLIPGNPALEGVVLLRHIWLYVWILVSQLLSFA